jgi:hypothetical protein
VVVFFSAALVAVFLASAIFSPSTSIGHSQVGGVDCQYVSLINLSGLIIPD